jgi:hypothetical protein
MARGASPPVGGPPNPSRVRLGGNPDRLKWGRALTNTPRSSGPVFGVHFTHCWPRKVSHLRSHRAQARTRTRLAYKFAYTPSARTSVALKRVGNFCLPRHSSWLDAYSTGGVRDRPLGSPPAGSGGSLALVWKRRIPRRPPTHRARGSQKCRRSPNTPLCHPWLRDCTSRSWIGFWNAGWPGSSGR